jgi:tRNA dimethylallyltransferase
LEAELAATGPAPLHARLAEADPAAAASILPSNGRRIIRALEVMELTGTRFTASLPDPVPYYPSVQIGLDLDTGVLDGRIAERVGTMWRLGLVDEVRRLTATGLRDGRTASRALGYQQVLRHLAGECSETQAAADTVQATRRFVRRQRSWFRRDARVHWLDAADPSAARRAVELARSGE